MLRFPEELTRLRLAMKSVDIAPGRPPDRDESHQSVTHFFERLHRLDVKTTSIDGSAVHDARHLLINADVPLQERMKLHHSTDAVLSPEVCKAFIMEADAEGFKRSPHADVNTCEQVSVSHGQVTRGFEQFSERPLMKWAHQLMYRIVGPLLRDLYGFTVHQAWREDPYNVLAYRQCCNDMFVTRYTTSVDQGDVLSAIPRHRDGALFAFVVHHTYIAHKHAC